MNFKILSLTIVIFTLSAHITTNCMKRPLENAEESNTKRIKHDNVDYLLQQENKLYDLLQRQYEHHIQLELLCAIEKRSIPKMTESLIKQPKHTFLEWAVALEFWQGTALILRYGKPTEQELRRSFDIAIRTENIPLINILLTKNTQLLDTKSKAHPQLKEVLRKNNAIVDILLNDGLTFIGAINMDLAIDTIEYIIKKTKPKDSMLDRALEYTNRTNRLHISYLLVAAKGNY